MFHPTRNRGVSTHRYAWEITFGPVPENLQVLHHCDNPTCCRPDHLFLGTGADNMADKVAKGRQPKGSQIPWSRLTESMVREDRIRHRQGQDTCIQLAKERGVALGTMEKAISGKTWKHVT